MVGTKKGGGKTTVKLKVGARKKMVLSRSSNAKSQNGSDNTTTVASAASNANDDLVEISSRPTLFNEETWWMLDLENKSVISTRQGATPLAARCQREYQWDETKCRTVLKAYRQFLMLKKHFQDWDATILSPSGPVDQMWHQHLLDVTHYCHDTKLLCGHVVGHNPDGALDHTMKTRRTKTTRDALAELFGSDYVKEMWFTQAELSAQEESTAVSGDDLVNIRLRDQTGEVTFYRTKRSFKLEKIFNSVSKKMGLCVDSLSFLFDGERINGQLSAADYNIDDQDQIDFMLEGRG
eukprot:CAMPEP_0170906834 /NCGR_PEP_ID=MMETSP0735-20130129/926_1 /TAXON_ID=186038 /ORGANISM="Fragilariopsis kerguelensis, Strain L26-C5" /LENGTH=293 /DNA_ID=CAMNT_0011302803 /DNA_START=104 /DNA_END=982 /DNA_ORIENTATION=+